MTIDDVHRAARRPGVALAALATLATVCVLAACSTSGSGTASTPSTSASGSPTAPATAPPTAPTSTMSRPSSDAPSTRARLSSPAPRVIPAPASPLRTVTTHDANGGSHEVEVWAERRDTTCQDHAYGQPMITFLTAHPCRGMQRLLATTTVHGRAVGFSLVDTGFSGTPDDPYADTSAFRTLVERDGTGSIDDLLREGYRLPSGPTSVPSPDAFACLGQDNGVSVYDLWYLEGPTPDNAPALEKLAQDIFLQL